MDLIETSCSVFFGALRLALDENRVLFGLHRQVLQEIIDQKEDQLRSEWEEQDQRQKRPLPRPLDEDLATFMIMQIYNLHLSDVIAGRKESDHSEEVRRNTVLFLDLMDQMFQNREHYAKLIVAQFSTKN